MFFSSVFLFDSLLVIVFQLLCRLGASFILMQFMPIRFWILVFCCSISFSHRHTIAIAHLNNFLTLYWEVYVCVFVCAHVCMAIKTSPEGVVVVAASAANNLHQRSKHIESSKTMNTKHSLSLSLPFSTSPSHTRDRSYSSLKMHAFTSFQMYYLLLSQLLLQCFTSSSLHRHHLTIDSVW